MATTLGVGIIGCGNISTTYLSLAPLFKGIQARACADINPEAADARAREFGVRAETVDNLLRAEDIDIVVNLTIPAAHFAVSRQILDAGKHVYTEKPFVLSLEDGLELNRLADAKRLRIGSAPDTFLGGAHQLARYLVDGGQIGRVTSGTCHVMSHGMEHWHPNPDFFFQPGGGPILDLGPYYVANLIQLLGPVTRVAALTSIPSSQRTIGCRPRQGERIPVATPTTIHALLEFRDGCTVTLGASWDVWTHRHASMELYGEAGTMYLPDPNFFGGAVRFTRGEQDAAPMAPWDHPLGVENQQHDEGMMANYRTVGLADMAGAIAAGRPHRCSVELALHTMDVLTSILRSGETRSFVDLQTTCERPDALGPQEAAGLLVEAAPKASS